MVKDRDFSTTRHGTLYLESKRAVVRPVGPAPTITTGQCCLDLDGVVEDEKKRGEKEREEGSRVCVAVLV